MVDVLFVILRLFLATMFVVSAVAKLADRTGTRQALAGFGVPEKFVRPSAIALPLIELTVAALLLPASTALWGGIAATLLLLLFTGAIAYNLRQGREPECNCFGAIAREPISSKTIVRNAILLGLSVLVVAIGLTESGPSTVAWVESLTGQQAAVLILLAVIAIAAAAIALAIPRLARTLNSIESTLSSVSEQIPIGAAPLDAVPAESVDHQIGLPVGSVAPAFTLDGVYGETGTLESLRSGGNPVLLVFSSPNCNPCNALMPDIGKWQREHGHLLTVAVIGGGEPAANRAKSAEHGLRNVLIQHGSNVSELYKVHFTPVGVLIDADGLIASPFAAGSEAIRTMVDDLVAQHVAINEPITIPEPATIVMAISEDMAESVDAGDLGRPDETMIGVETEVDDEGTEPVELADLDGNEVNLADLLTDSTVLLFWSPHCGYCTRMLDDLKAWESDKQSDAPNLLVISRGDAEENKAQAIGSMVVLDQAFALGRHYSAGGTPTGIPVDRNGNVTGDHAIGGAHVLALLKGEDPPEIVPPPAPVVLSVGQEAPAFSLPNLNGDEVALSDYKGSETFVMFWSPGCIHCQRMVDDIRAWEQNTPADSPRLLLVSRGDLEANKAAALSSNVLIDDENKAGSAYGSTGTPSGYLIDETGMVATELVVGAGAVFRQLKYVSDVCRECLDACDRQGGGEACRMVCQMSGQCY